MIFQIIEPNLTPKYPVHAIGRIDGICIRPAWSGGLSAGFGLIFYNL